MPLRPREHGCHPQGIPPPPACPPRLDVFLFSFPATDPRQIDFVLLAKKMGYANARVAQDSYHRFRAKLRGDKFYANRNGRSGDKLREKIRGLGDGGGMPSTYRCDGPLGDDEEGDEDFADRKGKWTYDELEEDKKDIVVVKSEPGEPGEARKHPFIKIEPDEPAEVRKHPFIKFEPDEPGEVRNHPFIKAERDELQEGKKDPVNVKVERNEPDVWVWEGDDVTLEYHDY